MATTSAVLQFEYGWALYQQGERGDQLWSNVANYAKAHKLSDSYRLPLHCLKVVAGSPATEPQVALRAFLLACELARRNKGLNHHVVALCAARAGLLGSPADRVTQATVERATQLLRERAAGLPAAEAPAAPASAPPAPAATPAAAAEPASTTGRVSADADVYRLGRVWLIGKAQQSLGLTEGQATRLVDLHLDPRCFAMDTVADYGPIEQAIRSGATHEAVVALLTFEDVASMRGIFRVHCRNLVNRQGVTDVNTGGPNPPKAPRILRFLDSLTEENWHGFDDVAALAVHYRAVAEAAPAGIFDAADLGSFAVAARVGSQLREMQSSSAGTLGMKQGWLKVFKGMADGVRYLARFGFDAARFHAHVRAKLASFADTEALVQDYQRSVAEVGTALAPNFFADLGFPEFSKPDTHVRQAVKALTGEVWSDREVFRYTADRARQYGVTPRQLDKVFYLIGSGNFYLAGLQLSGDGKERRAEFVHGLPKDDAGR